MKHTNKIFGTLLLALMLVFQSFTVNDTEINYSKESWNKVVKQAKQQKKLILVYVGNSSCHSCKDLQKSLSNQAVVDFYNKNLINYYLDSESTANIIKASKWGVTQVPSMVFLDSKKNVVHIV